MQLHPLLCGHTWKFVRGLSGSPFPSSHPCFDLVIIGGGIVGLATAREMKLRHANMKIAVLEKEQQLSMHQSKNNSGVIHAGIYYAPGSLRAKLCVEGLRKSYDYLDKSNIPYKRCGKLIVATEDRELEQLHKLYSTATSNGVSNLSILTVDQIRELEPLCSGKEALYSPNTGIVDWRQVALSFASDFEELGGTIYLNFCANTFTETSGDCDYPIQITAKSGSQIQAKYVITCAGLHSDRVAKLAGCSAYPKIVPFRGEYLKLKDGRDALVKTNIYPVPDSRFPFLGVHFTPRIDGSLWLGPNAILAFSREGYNKLDFNMKDTIDTLTYPGFWKLAGKYVGFGTKEMINSVMLKRQTRQLQRFVPSLDYRDVEHGPSGVRAQALDPSGKLVEDFVVDYGTDGIGKRILNVRNAPSPAATSSLAISCMIADAAKAHFDLPNVETRKTV